MPWLPIYADTNDFRVIHDWLSSKRELAYLVSDGPRRWRAVAAIENFATNKICIWHVPSGPLPLIHSDPNSDVAWVTDPWRGWQELRSGADSNQPYFGAGHPGILWLNHLPFSRRSERGIGLSSFEWIGNHYGVIGNKADPTTESFWRSMRRWTQKQTKKIPRVGALDGAPAEVFAFPSAYRAFENGVERDSNA